jgi:hypothetical protein
MAEPVGWTCPVCGSPAVAELPFDEQAFCGNDDCPTLCWNPTLTFDENLDSFKAIELPKLGEEP